MKDIIKKMPLITRLKILESQYNDLYPVLEISKLVLEALKTLPPDLMLEPRIEKTMMGMPVREEMTVGKRIEELKRDVQVFGARVEIIKRELENEQKRNIPSRKIKDLHWDW